MNPKKRCAPWSRDTVKFIGRVRMLKESGHSNKQIAETENCGEGYIQSVLCLLEHGCPLLLSEIEKDRMPHTIAMAIARVKDRAMQEIFIEGYQANVVNLKEIIAIRQRIEAYQREASRQKTAGDTVMRHFSDAMSKQRQLIENAKAAKLRLRFITKAFKRLLSDGNFAALLHIEGIHSMPTWLADDIKGIN